MSTIFNGPHLTERDLCRMLALAVGSYSAPGNGVPTYREADAIAATAPATDDALTLSEAFATLDRIATGLGIIWTLDCDGYFKVRY